LRSKRVRKRGGPPTATYASLPLYLVFFGTIAFCIFFPDVVL